MHARAKDEGDMASEEEEYLRQEALFNARRSERRQLRGKCYNCGEPTPQHFCDKDCRKDYERAQEILRRQRGETWR